MFDRTGSCPGALNESLFAWTLFLGLIMRPEVFPPRRKRFHPVVHYRDSLNADVCTTNHSTEGLWLPDISVAVPPREQFARRHRARISGRPDNVRFPRRTPRSEKPVCKFTRAARKNRCTRIPGNSASRRNAEHAGTLTRPNEPFRMILAASYRRRVFCALAEFRRRARGSWGG